MPKTKLLNSEIMDHVDDCFVDSILAHYAVWYTNNVQKPQWEFLSNLGNIQTFINFVANSIGKELHQRYGDNFKEELRKMPMEEAFDICTKIADNSILLLSHMHTLSQILPGFEKVDTVAFDPKLFK